MGKVYLNDKNELVVLTNNGKIEGNKTTTEISSSEKFEIDAATISKLLVLMNDLTLCDKKLYHFGNFYTIISKEELAQCVEDERQRANKREKEYVAIEGRFISLIERIRKYNSDKKLFWRPINIDDVCVN